MVLAVVVLLLGLPGAIGAGPTGMPTEHADALGHASKTAKAGPRGYFEPNHGQFPDHVRFVVHGVGTNAFLTDGGVTFVIEGPVSLPAPLADSSGEPFMESLLKPVATPEPASLFAVKLRFEDARPGTMEGTERRQGISNHFIGDDPDKWVTHIPHYGRVVQKDVWPGIDVEWHIAPEGLKFDAVVHPGGDPKQVRFTLPGAEGLTLDAAGDLVIGTPLGSLVKEVPFTYQETTKGQQEVPSRYVLDGGTVGFELGDHDPSKTLVIDPLIYSTYVAAGFGQGQIQTAGNGIAVDADGQAHITGASSADSFPTKGGPYGTPGGGSNIFALKLTPEGDEFVFATLIGSQGTGSHSGDNSNGIALDSNGNVYLAGTTAGEDFPTQNAYRASNSGGRDAFVSKLSPDGGTLMYSTYFGGETSDAALGIAADDEGGAYITGWTRSQVSFPLTPNAPQPVFMGGAPPANPGSAFVAKLNTTASGDASLVYSTYLGGIGEGAKGADKGLGIAVDAEGHAYVTGIAASGGFPVTSGAFQASKAGSGDFAYDAFVTKYSPEGDRYVYSTYLGGSGQEYGFSIQVDDGGSAYVVGTTRSGDFPTNANTPTETPSFETEYPGWPGAVFLTKLDPSGSSAVYSTFVGQTLIASNGVPFGGSGDGESWYGPAVAVDGNGQAFVSGWTSSDAFPTKNAFQGERRGTGTTTDAFVAGFRPDGSELVWSTYFGGTGADRAKDVAVDAAGSVYITGWTAWSAEDDGFPLRNAAQTTRSGGFAAKLYGVTADFDWIPEMPCPGEAVRFRDLSMSLSGATGAAGSMAQSQWDLSDGGTPRVFDPWQNSFTATYAQEGNYTVTLRATDMNGATAFATHVVEVPWCPPPNHPPSLKALPCIVASPDQRLSFHIHASVPVFPDDPSSYSTLTFSAEGLPSGAAFQQDGDFSARFTWDVGPPDTYTFVVHVEDGGLPDHGMPSLSDSKEYCIEVRPEKTAPGRIDSSGDGVQDWHDACPHMKSPDQADAAAGDGLDDACDATAPPEHEDDSVEEGPPPGGCPSQPAGPREVTARWTDGAVQVTWQSDSWCPPDHFLVWNGTGHHLVDFVVAEAGVHYVVLNTDPWPEPHQYFVQAMGADEGLFFDPTRAVASNLIDPAGCILEGPRSDACLPLGIGEAPPAAVEPAAPEAPAPADDAPVGLIAAAAALVVGGLMALLWRLRHAPWIVYLASRLQPGDLLDHPIRKAIVEEARKQPGLSPGEMQELVGCSRGNIDYHVNELVAGRHVKVVSIGGRTRVFPPGSKDPEAVAMLRNGRMRDFAMAIVKRPGISQKAIADRTGMSRKVMGRYREELLDLGLIKVSRAGGTCLYNPKSNLKRLLKLALEGNAEESTRIGEVDGSAANEVGSAPKMEAPAAGR